MTIKEKYDEFDAFLKTQDADKIKYLTEFSIGFGRTSTKELDALQDSYRWFETINEFKYSGGSYNYKEHKYEGGRDFVPYILGDKKITIEFIAKYMGGLMKEWRVSGDVQDYWEGLDEKSLIDVVCDRDVHYELRDSHDSYVGGGGFEGLAFAYLIHVKEMTTEELQKEMYNSNEIEEKVFELYIPENFRTFTVEEIDSLHNQFNDKEIKHNEHRFNKMIENITEQFGNDPHFKSKIKKIKEMTF